MATAARPDALQFVEGPDEITDEDEIEMRVLLSCGHTAAPDSVTQWCKYQLSQGKTTFHCPVALGNNKSCNAVWSYGEILKIALQTGEDMSDFEEKMAFTAAKQFCEYKPCPGCSTLVEREDMENLRVLCTICKPIDGRSPEFCWQCLKPWIGGGTSSVRCNNTGCKDHRLDILQQCALIDLPSSEIKSCPSVRACPVCGLLIEHREDCKYIFCKQCGEEFCFACLEGAKTCRSNKQRAFFETCSKPMAPRQTVVPVWSAKREQSKPSTADNEESHFDLVRWRLSRQPFLIQELLLQLQLLHEQLPPPPTLAQLPTPPPTPSHLPTPPPTLPPTPPPLLTPPPTHPPLPTPPPKQAESSCIIL